MFKNFSVEDCPTIVPTSPSIGEEEENKNTSTGENIEVDIKTIAVDLRIVNTKSINSTPIPSISTIDKVEITQREDEEHDTNPRDEVQFASVKEKQCWEMYCKMSEKGLKVPYDTILRGMLTPTEYRMRRHHSIDSINVSSDPLQLDPDANNT